MELIVGGAYQGKWGYAQERFPHVVWVDGGTCTLEGLLRAGGVYRFHVFLDRQMRQGEEVQDLPELIMKENPGLVIVSDEVGYGVVPVDAHERAFREMVGRVCCKLAQRADRVHRVVCGIGTVIRDV